MQNILEQIELFMIAIHWARFYFLFFGLVFLAAGHYFSQEPESWLYVDFKYTPPLWVEVMTFAGGLFILLFSVVSF